VMGVPVVKEEDGTFIKIGAIRIVTSVLQWLHELGCIMYILTASNPKPLWMCLDFIWMCDGILHVFEIINA
jgi:hypothetical protein